MNTYMVGHKTALITGASGYIGSCLAKRLIKEGWVVHLILRQTSRVDQISSILDHIQVHIYDGSTEGLYHIVREVQPDFVFHLAAVATVRNDSDLIIPMLQSNVVFGTQLADAMTANGIYRLINTGTFVQHFNHDEYNPSCLYAATKQAFEDILRFYIETTPLHAITLKLFDNYGPSDPRPKIMNLLYKHGKENLPLAVSPGEQLLDIVYIDDVITAYILAAERMLHNKGLKKHEIFAVSSQTAISLKELVRLFEQISGFSLDIHWGALPYRDREVMVPWNKGQVLPNWKAVTPIQEGIKLFLASKGNELS